MEHFIFMNNYTEKERQILLNIVDDAIKFGFAEYKILKPNLANYSQKLAEFGASFVTIELANELRGCIGTLEAYQPLIQDVAQNAFSAAFQDPRFNPLTIEEYPKITKHISILSKPEPVIFSSEKDLLNKIRPNIDGLILSDRGYRGTFLPVVWESLPIPELFLKHLKLKAGLPENYWSNTIKIKRYTTEYID
jgi:uncharacterized protein